MEHALRGVLNACYVHRDQVLRNLLPFHSTRATCGHVKHFRPEPKTNDEGLNWPLRHLISAFPTSEDDRRAFETLATGSPRSGSLFHVSEARKSSWVCSPWRSWRNSTVPLLRPPWREPGPCSGTGTVDCVYGCSAGSLSTSDLLIKIGRSISGNLQADSGDNMILSGFCCSGWYPINTRRGLKVGNWIYLCTKHYSSHHG